MLKFDICIDVNKYIKSQECMQKESGGVKEMRKRVGERSRQTYLFGKILSCEIARYEFHMKIFIIQIIG